MASRTANQQVGHNILGTVELCAFLLVCLFVADSAIYINANTVRVTQPGRLEKYVLSTQQTSPTRPA